MNLRLLFISFIFLATLNSINAQVFPYLNASTGNENEFIVDADSNVYMFHKNIIEKFDKNFNPIWINSYSNLYFKNLLLSKTGSMFFIATDFSVDVLGKIESNGNLTWCKTTPNYTAMVGSNTQTITPSADQILLDRNNNLIVTGVTHINTSNLYFLKLDTLGNLIKLRSFENSFFTDAKESMVVTDINGIYTVSSWGFGYAGGASYNLYNFIYKYSDATNLIIGDPLLKIGYVNAGYHVSNEHIIKSKNNSDIFYTTICNSFYNSSLNNTFNLRKLKDTTALWNMEFQILSPYLMSVQNIEEDNLKNVFLSIIVTDVTNYSYERWVIKLDSNGVSDNTKQIIVKHPGSSNMNQVADTITQFQHHFGKNYFYSIKPVFSLSDPLTIIKMDSTIGSYCSSSGTISIIPSTNYIDNHDGIGTIVTAIVSSTLTTVPSTINSVLGFSINVSNCLPQNVNRLNDIAFISLYPNPVQNILTIKSTKDYIINEVNIFDVTGKRLSYLYENKSIDISNLNKGIYFIKIKTDQGEFSQKFIKE